MITNQESKLRELNIRLAGIELTVECLDRSLDDIKNYLSTLKEKLEEERTP